MKIVVQRVKPSDVFINAASYPEAHKNAQCNHKQHPSLYYLLEKLENEEKDIAVINAVHQDRTSKIKDFNNLVLKM